MTAAIQIRLLGTPTVQNNQTPATLGARAQALLYYLATTGQTQTRSALAGLLWGESEEDLARMNLRKSLVDLRKVLGERIVADYQTVTLQRIDCWIDLVEFQRVTQQAGTLDLAQLQAGLELYQGEFLAGFFLRNAPEYENWLLGQRAYYRELALSGWQTLAQRHAHQGDRPAAMQAVRRVLLLEPWREEAHRWLMGWLAESDQRTAALAQYELCRRHLADELAVEPSAETVALYEEIRTGKFDKVTSPSPITQSPRHHVTPSASSGQTLSSPHNLPPQPTTFVGRQRELKEVYQRLADPTCRLLTLVGPGGMGKTRLAIETAKTMADGSVAMADLGASTFADNSRSTSCNAQFNDGRFFVPLASVNTPSALVTAIAEAVAFTFQNNLSPRQQLLNYLADKKLLLLLDNFEHLLAGIDLLLEILNGAPGVKLLVTSREILNLQQEWLYPVGGLSIPTGETPPDAQLTTSDAIRLFTQSARRALPSFDLTVEWRCALRICRQVDGMPLGIELATTWLRTLTCSQIADEIQRNLDFLASRLHNLPERHRSMRAVFAHSWQLLTSEEQQVLRRLSVLHGFCQEGAAEVAAASLLTLTTLAEKSLIQVVRSEGHGRYLIHELVRQFAAEKLQADATEQAMICERHSAYYLGRLGAEASAFNGSQQRAALRSLGEEMENIRIAWLRTAQQMQVEKLAQRLDELYTFYTLSHRYQEGVELLEATLQALTLENAESADGIVRKVLNRLGGLYTHLGRYERAQTLLTTGLTLSQNLAMERECAFCLRGLGEIAGWQGNFALGQRHLTEALAFSRALGDREGEAQALARLCDFALGLSDHQTNKALFEQYLVVGRHLANHRFVIHALRLLAFNAYTLGEYSATTTYCQEGLRLAEELDEPLELSLMLTVYLCNSVVIDTVQPSEAKVLSARSFSLVQESRQPYYIAMTLYMISQALCALHEEELAEQYCQQGLLVARSANAVALIVGSLAVLGRLYCQRSEFQRSRRLLCEALQTGITAGILLLTLEALVYFGALLCSESKNGSGEEATTKQVDAVALLTLTIGEPACMQIFKDQATRLLGELRVALPVEVFSRAQARGQQLTLATAVAEILR